MILDQVTDSMSVAQQAESVQIPYVLLAGLLLLLAAIFSYIKLPVVEHNEALEEKILVNGSAWQYRHLVLGAIGILSMLAQKFLSVVF